MAYFLIKKIMKGKSTTQSSNDQLDLPPATPATPQDSNLPNSESILPVVEAEPKPTSEALPHPKDYAHCAKKKHDSRMHRWKLMAGLFLPSLLPNLDLTVVATALPFIASHFSGCSGSLIHRASN